MGKSGPDRDAERPAATPAAGRDPDAETSVRTVVRVDAPIEHAFRVFTAEFASWWPASHHIGQAPLVTAIVEPRIGGRWYELDSDGSTCDWGTVLAWDPPRHVALSWYLDEEFRRLHRPDHVSRIDVRFTAQADGSTEVELVHSNLDAHGEGWRRLRDRVGAPGGWPGLLRRYAERLAGTPGRS